MKRIKPEELVEGQKYLLELKFINDDWSDCFPLKFNNTENETDYDYFERDVKIYSLEENDKVIIPKIVADKIKYLKQYGDYSLFQAMDYCYQYKDTADWLKGNQYTFARAWFEGYEVEKEPLYWVRNKEGKSLLSRFSKNVNTSSGYDIDQQKIHKKEYTFTEKEIKDYDERYWAFAVPVEDE